MRPAPTTSDQAHFFRSPALPETELLTARYRTHSFAPHWHEGYVVAVVLDGAEGYRYRGAQHVAGAGGIACINPGEVHTGERAAEEGWAYRVFYPSASVIADLASQLRGGKAQALSTGLPRLPQNVVEDRPVANALVRAHLLLEAGQDALEAQTATLNALSALLTRHAQAPNAAPSLRGESARVEAMRQRLSAELTEPLTLDQLAASVGLSPFHAARLFAQATGMPPHAWRNQQRLNRSLDLLRAGQSVAEAAVACGFTDQSHYTRHFRRAYGTSPGRWRG
jgi:AraC-like DNA-binding protein